MNSNKDETKMRWGPYLRLQRFGKVLAGATALAGVATAGGYGYLSVRDSKNPSADVQKLVEQERLTAGLGGLTAAFAAVCYARIRIREVKIEQMVLRAKLKKNLGGPDGP
jgi:hypothetical protein